MEIKQAVAILKQGLDIALSSGAFKKTEDVSTLHTALVTINDFVNKDEEAKSMAKQSVVKLDSGEAKVSKRTK